MKQINMIMPFLALLFFTVSCDNIQERIDVNTKKLQETADKQINEHLGKVDSTLNKLDTTIHSTIDKQLEKADSMISDLNKNLN